MDAEKPNRWMRLRHPYGFTDELFAQFCALCRIFRAYVEASLAETRCFPVGPARYVFFEPELSADRRVASLPLSGTSTLGSRHGFEDMSSFMLWHRFPLGFREQLEEGLTEDIGDGRGLQTNWRKPTQGIWFFTPPQP